MRPTHTKMMANVGKDGKPGTGNGNGVHMPKAMSMGKLLVIAQSVQAITRHRT
jgi:hypothetical protein